MYTRETEIRHISPADIYRLGQILEQTQSWKKLMTIIPKESQSSPKHQGKYNNDHITLVESASIKQNRMCTEILIEEWGTSGRKRPTVGLLLDLLVKAELYRAADFVALNFLNEPPPARPLKGPAARIDISIPLESEEIREVDKILNQMTCPGTETLIENAQIPSQINNKDFYEKIRHNEKKLDIPQSDLIKFSTNSFNITSDLPNLSSLDQNIVNNDNSENSGTDNVSIAPVELNSIEIPALSALHIENSFLEEALPDLSALNFTENETDGLKLDDKSVENSPIRSVSSASVDDSSLTPNLSILDQSNLNDSSLTNVTETSEENIFDSNENVHSENIPCISALNN